MGKLRTGINGLKSYNIWRKMIDRCCNERHPTYKYSGARGIKIKYEWHNYYNFVADVGEPPDGMTLDRIDNNGNYTPENCRWATRKQQANNRRDNRRITFNGVTKTISEWAEQLGTKHQVVSSRLSRGWAEAEALTTPVQKRKR